MTSRVYSLLLSIALVFFVCLGIAPAQDQSLAVDNVLTRALGRKPLIELENDEFLQNLLTVLASRGVTPKDGVYLNFSRTDGSVMAIPLTSASNPEANNLYLYYIPKTEQYLFLQAARNPEKEGMAELRLWSGEDEKELVFSETGLSTVLSAPSRHTFRVDGIDRFRSKRKALDRMATTERGITPGEWLTCIGQTLGVSADFSGLTIYFASAACSALDTFGSIQTALHCISMATSVSPTVINAASTFGCLTGAAKLISCGIVNCNRPTPTPTPTTMPCDRSLAFNASVAGSWTSACVSVNRPNSYAIYYTFSINTQTSLEINLEASGVDSFMFLMNGQGRNGSVIASDDDSGGSRNARISTMLNPGTYTIEATTYEPRTTGAFGISIAIRTPPVVVPPVVTPPTGGLDPCLAQIDINGSISSSWTSTCSSTGRSGHFAKYYVFTLQTSRAIQVDLRSTTDPFLILRTGTGRTGNIIAQNDDADGLNSRINTTLGPGTYVIEATTFAPSATGGFTVSLR